MKGLLLFGIIFMLSLPVLGDPGNCYCFRASVQIQQKVINGYFQVNTYEEVNKAVIQDFVNRKETFAQFVKTHTNGADSLQLYKDILVVDKTTPVLLTRLVSSPWQDIKGISYQSVTSCAVGTSILTTLSLNDKGWVTKQAVRRESMPESETCAYDIIYYIPKDNTITQLLEKLAKATKEQNTAGVARIVQALKQKRVVVGLGCSC
jgi:hypothetical protein